MKIDEAELERLLAEKRQLQVNLTECQKLCDEQLIELRVLRFKVTMAEAGPSPIFGIDQ